MSKKNKKTSAAADAVREKAENAADAMKEKAEDAADAVKEKAEDAADAVKEKAEDAADAVKEKAEDAADAVKEKAEDAADAVKEKAEDAADAMKEKAEDAAKSDSYNGILGDYKEQPEETDEGIGDGPQPAPAKEKKPVSNKALAGVGIAASVVLVGCLSVIGIRAMQANKPVPVVTSDHYTVDKDVFTCFYQDTLKSIREYYGDEMLLSYYQLDMNKSLKEQPYPMDDGTTWFDNFVNEALGGVQQHLMFAEAGIDAGYTIPDEDLQKINEIIETADMSVYGPGVTKSDLREALMIQMFGTGYFNSYINSLSFTDDEIEAYYDANSENLVSCGLLGFTINFTEDSDETSLAEESDSAAGDASAETASSEAASSEEASAEETASEAASAEESASAESSSGTDAADEEQGMDKETARRLADELKACKDPAAFEQKVRSILKDYEKLSDDEIELRIDAIYNDKYGYTAGADLSEWAFKSGAKVNDTKVMDGEGAYYVYMLTSEPSRDESSVIDVRHILFAVSEHAKGTEEADNTAALEECRKLGQECLAAWEAGDKTEDSFAALATERTEDPGSKETGGLYQNVFVGQMVPEFNDWCFDPARKPGDTGIVETSYGVHVMYFVSDNGPKWKADIKNALIQEKYTEWLAELQEKYTITTDPEAAKTING